MTSLVGEVSVSRGRSIAQGSPLLRVESLYLGGGALLKARLSCGWSLGAEHCSRLTSLEGGVSVSRGGALLKARLSCGWSLGAEHCSRLTSLEGGVSSVRAPVAAQDRLFQLGLFS